MKQRYPGLMIFLHWLMAILIIATFALGTVMVDMRISPTKLKYFSWHKWLGVTLLALVAWRLITCLLHQKMQNIPALPDSMPGWEKLAAHGGHLALYVLMFALPITGYLYSSASGYPVVYLGLVELPTLIGPNPELKETLKTAHDVLSKLLFLVVALHFAAALKHHFISKDGILKRMLPGSDSTRPTQY